MNTGVSWPDLFEAEVRVHAMQKKLHCWATADPGRCLDDLYNLVYDPAFLVVAWSRVRGNRGARTAGVDRVVPRSIDDRQEEFLDGLRAGLKTRQFTPAPVRQAKIPKRSGKLRNLGIPTAADRVVQASLKLVLEPIFEGDFEPCSYGFRPNRRAQDAIAEIHYLGSSPRNYEWVLEADIEACFDQISHSALMERIRDRIGDKRVLRLIRMFLRAGVLTEDGVHRDTYTGTPQGGILSPLLANIALSVLDEHFTDKWEALGGRHGRARHRRNGGAVFRIIRYADDFVIMATGGQDDVEAVRGEVAAVLAPMGLGLSEAKTRVVHIDDGFQFLGFHIQRRPIRGTNKRAVFTYPSRQALVAVCDKIRRITRRGRHRTLADLLTRLNPVLRGWCQYFRFGVSKRTFSYLGYFAWWRVVGWIRKRHVGLNWETLIRRHVPNWEISDNGAVLFRCDQVPVTRYRYRGSRIPTPWAATTTA